MTIDKSIFGLRFGSNEDLSPTLEELRVFLESPKKEGGREPRKKDFARYGDLIESVAIFERSRQPDEAPLTFGERMFSAVVSLSQFANPVLRRSVEQYQYLLHVLISLDFKKPAVFINAAEGEMSKLNPKKKDDAVRLDRLRGLVDDRKKSIETLKRRSNDLMKELGDIALYIRDNLVRIEKLCEASIVIIVELQISRKKENQLINDIQSDFKERLRDALHEGAITKQRLELVKRDVNSLTKELSVLLREDIYSLTGLFETIHEHTKKTTGELDTLLARIKKDGNRGFEENCKLLVQIGQTFISLISDYNFGLKAPELRNDSAHKDILMEKRNEMLEHVFELLQKERRARGERRSNNDRRDINEPKPRVPQRRLEKDRRTGKNRRT